MVTFWEGKPRALRLRCEHESCPLISTFIGLSDTKKGRPDWFAPHKNAFVRTAPKMNSRNRLMAGKVSGERRKTNELKLYFSHHCDDLQEKNNASSKAVETSRRISRAATNP
eukprot:gb/GEZJ01005240.1/.p1 GENE.gb/GEZJ01005240.1/~~gb/GEZJ01005240.1/.p1  ORF type:complete len:112 (-),score=13.03 gb/GEZJ01005240.1/:273-608(-)